MNDISFRAVIQRPSHIIDDFDTVVFNLNDMINPIFSVRELVIPWLLSGNKPDRWTGEIDIDKNYIYENDIVKIEEYYIGDYHIKCHKGIVKFSKGEFYIGSQESEKDEYDNFSDCILNKRLSVVGNTHKGILKEEPSW